MFLFYKINKFKMPKVETELSNENLKTAASKAVKKKNSFSFNLDDYKKGRNILHSARFKPQEWLPLSPAFNNSIGLPGVPLGHITIIRGHSDTGKTTAMVEAAIATQQAGKLPVFIITEMKWSWEHAIQMGFQADIVPDLETGEVTYSGNFIYVDRSNLNCIEDIAAFITSLFDDQKKGKLPYDLVFLWDSAGSIPSQQSLDSGKNNAMWNAAAMATQFGNYVNQMFTMTRKPESKFTNTFIVVNKIRVEYPIGNPNEKPKMRNKAGDAMYWDASLVVTFGNITNSGTSKIEAIKNGLKVTFAKRTKISVDKNHMTDATSTTKIIMTPYGFIEDTPKSIDSYKKARRNEWLNILKSDDFEIIEEADIEEDFAVGYDDLTEE
jgi:RecA/RadA recombinase